MLTVLLIALWAGPPVTVQGDSTCPAPAEVAPRLTGLLRANAAAATPDVALLGDQGGALSIRLQRPDGSLIGERTLERLYPCADLAAAAAVILATWESDVHPAFRPTLAPPRADLTRAAPSSSPPTAGAVAFDLGGALTGSLAPGGGGAGGALGALLVGGVTRARLGGRLALQAGTERTMDLGTGAVHWRRLAAALGPQLRFRPAAGRTFLDLHLEMTGAWVLAGGTGFTTNRQDSSADVGVGAGVRLLFAGRALTPWVDLSAAGWLRQQQAYTIDGGSVTLPRIEGTLALGLSYCACP